jgi:multisubunit Na+/H+ antiporter MnhE subunit
MLHAAAMLGVLIVLWIAAAPASGSPQDWAIAAGASLVCVAVAARFGGISTAFMQAPRLLWIASKRAGALFMGAMSVIRRAVSADVTLSPALVRVKTRSSKPEERAAFAHLLTSIPGVAVVETEADGLLAHVINEEGIDATELGRLEQALSQGSGR